MMDKHSWWALSIGNSVCIICWSWLAFVFNHWWIALFAAFFVFIFKTNKNAGSRWFICDCCGKHSPEGKTFDEAEKRRLEAGWLRRKNNDKWEDICPECKIKIERSRQELQEFFRKKYTPYYEENTK